MSGPNEADLRRKHVALLESGKVREGPWKSGTWDMVARRERHGANSQHLALCSPERVLALYQELAKARALIEALKADASRDPLCLDCYRDAYPSDFAKDAEGENAVAYVAGCNACGHSMGVGG